MCSWNDEIYEYCINVSCYQTTTPDIDDAQSYKHEELQVEQQDESELKSLFIPEFQYLFVS